MKIAQIVCAYPPYAGGIGNSAYRFHELLSVKHDIVNFTPDNTRPFLRRGHGAVLPQLLWKLRKFDYIYLHYPFFGTAEIVWLFKIFCKRPKLIIQYHMDVKNQSSAAKILSLPSRLIRDSLFNKAEVIVSSSLDYVKHGQLKKYYESHMEKFQEIPFGIDLQKFQPNPISQPSANNLIAKVKNIVKHINDLFIKKDRLDLIFIGGLDKAHYFKGVSVLLNSLPSLDQRKWNLKIVGDGDLRPEYENLAARLNLNKRVEFAGKLSDAQMIKALQNSDLLILPSVNNNEAFGLVLIEALACGVPVIASDLPGVRKVFADKREGLLVIPGSVEDLNRKLEFVLKNEGLRQEMAKAARRLAIRKYDQELMKQKYENLFAEQSL
ncbi:MAG: glycosyltransferase family 4 protein [Patescibacteria group bacterium]|jgi:glycosyltransferase involved in cell wall biosynthesis